MTLFQKLKDPVSSISHFAGAVAAIPCTAVLVYYASSQVSLRYAMPFAVFGIAMFLLYMASSVYHGLITTENVSKVLRRIDHMMIFVLIAGTYTPICLITLKGVWGYTLLAVVWGMAVVGMTVKAFWNNPPQWTSSVIYVCMGWAVVFAFYPLSQAVSASGITMLVLGGVSYTIGAVIYALKRPPLPFKYIGYHEIFHFFVLGGSVFHIIFMFKYVLFA